MFHDVINEFFPTSGFKKIGAAQYTIDSKKFESFVKETSNLDNDIIFSFDDGGSSFYNVISPILEKYAKKGIFFISTKYIGSEGFLTKEQIAELHKRGHIIASHSHTHPRDISKLRLDEIIEEWKLSKGILEDITKSDVNIASIPGGAISKKVLQGLHDAGYKEIYSSKPTEKSYKYSDMIIKGRFTISNSTTTIHLKDIITNSSYRNKLCIRYEVLHFCKVLLGSNYNKLKQLILKAGK